MNISRSLGPLLSNSLASILHALKIGLARSKVATHDQIVYRDVLRQGWNRSKFLTIRSLVGSEPVAGPSNRWQLAAMTYPLTAVVQLLVL